jgi:predicted lipid-binding transport protein (Tim44 family)
MRFAATLIIAIVCGLALPGLVEACPSCVETVAANSVEAQSGTSGSMAGGLGGGMARGYYYSILFMLAMLFGVAGTFVFFVVRHARAESHHTTIRAQSAGEYPSSE